MCRPREKWCVVCVGHLINISTITINYYYYYHLKLNFYKVSVGTGLHTFVPTSVPASRHITITFTPLFFIKNHFPLLSFPLEIIPLRFTQLVHMSIEYYIEWIWLFLTCNSSGRGMWSRSTHSSHNSWCGAEHTTTNDALLKRTITFTWTLT